MKEHASISKNEMARISLELMQRDFAARPVGSNELSVDTIQRYHEAVFGIHNVSSNGWTPDFALRSIDTLAAREIFWDNLLNASNPFEATGILVDPTQGDSSFEAIAWRLELSTSGATTAFGGSNSYGPYSVSILGGGVMIGDGVANSTLTGGEGNDVIMGFVGSDTLHGGAGDDRLYGGGGVDQIDGGSGDDMIWGGRQNDIVIGGLGNDFSDGGADSDTLDYSALGLNFTFALDTAASGGADAVFTTTPDSGGWVDRFTDFETVVLSTQDTTLTINGANTLEALNAEAITVDGNSGNNTVDLSGVVQGVTVDLGAGALNVTGGTTNRLLKVKKLAA